MISEKAFRATRPIVSSYISILVPAIRAAHVLSPFFDRGRGRSRTCAGLPSSLKGNEGGDDETLVVGKFPTTDVTVRSNRKSAFFDHRAHLPASPASRSTFRRRVHVHPPSLPDQMIRPSHETKTWKKLPQVSKLLALPHEKRLLSSVGKLILFVRPFGRKVPCYSGGMLAPRIPGKKGATPVVAVDEGGGGGGGRKRRACGVRSSYGTCY